MNEIDRLIKLCGKEWVDNFVKTFDHMGEMLVKAIIKRDEVSQDFQNIHER